ncbi:hypothetical protein N658DRAFT_11127 [Parathielavia hyrcaniae]|uniref:Uncharacterized protein n=1 Tax=Parathielavia hyrcaniae TaxID=113614 RepID=A0AAN6Q9P0_9PEZI|nr:hypothetical protein N658DRAFT_11127 [Parathielavia hyrcaniae]
MCTAWFGKGCVYRCHRYTRHELAESNPPTSLRWPPGVAASAVQQSLNIRPPPRLLPVLVHRFITGPSRMLIALPLIYAFFPIDQVRPCRAQA